MTFRLDRNQQLVIQLPYDVAPAKGEPDTLVLSVEQTEELSELLRDYGKNQRK